MTISAKITNRTGVTVYVCGCPLKPGISNVFPFVSEKITIMSESIGYVILYERGTFDSNSRLSLSKKDDYNNFDIIAK